MTEAATIKAIEASSVHQIQSGQVIVDLCSVAKELVENSLDAGATAIEVRFKNQGLDSIEVQDNGSGIASQSYEGVALKHHTSKLSSYADLDTLHTFGFRGEALSSLCALSHFTVTTCLQSEVPKGTRLEFEVSGKLKGTGVVAAQKGTTVTVETLFHNLPVRRRELERNIKREWGKVINLLNQYACIQTGIKFTVSQQPNKGKRTVLFSTKGNKTTRENIVNVFGAKTLSALITLDLELELEPTTGRSAALLGGGGVAQAEKTTVRVRGHVSRPARDQGRQTPDRQMFYVNGRPCSLPQFAKVFNEVYRTYNSTQSPFIFADIQLDTHLYDVNVSPDKRTILLHDQGRMLDNMREALIELFETQDITIPVAQLGVQKLTTPFKTPVVGRFKTTLTPSSLGAGSSDRGDDTPTRPRGQDLDSGNSAADITKESDVQTRQESESTALDESPTGTPAESPRLISRWAERNADARAEISEARPPAQRKTAEARREPSVSDRVALLVSNLRGEYSYADEPVPSPPEVVEGNEDEDDGQNGEEKEAENEAEHGKEVARSIPTSAQPSGREEVVETDPPESPIPAIPPPRSQGLRAGPLPSILSSLKRPSAEVATITVGNHTVTSIIGGPATKRPRTSQASQSSHTFRSRADKGKSNAPLPSFGGRLTQMFAAASARQATGTSVPEHLSTEAAMEDDASSNEGSEDGDADRQSEEENASVASEKSGLFVEDFVVEEEQASPPEDKDDETPARAHACAHDDENDSDGEYLDEEAKKKREEEKVQQMILEAERKANEPSEEMQKRSHAFVKGGSRRKDSTLTLVQQLKVDEEAILRRESRWHSSVESLCPPQNEQRAGDASPGIDDGLDAATENAEEKLSLTITKADFDKMKIIGQFNLGFIIAVREAADHDDTHQQQQQQQQDPQPRVQSRADDELFIIDQHASDEKYNFERLQATTVLQTQRLVRPRTLELTALEEEVVMENRRALEANGFAVEIDESGDSPVGSRCRLVGLPLSRETTFSVADLEELVALLAENPTPSATTVPRPGRVRRMLAMRACRSSIMVGKALSATQMGRVVRHMGGMEKPWNCPHGRPTMRHLCGLGAAWDGRAWSEGEGFDGEVEEDWSVYEGGV